MGGGDAPVVSQKFVQDAKIPTLYTIDRITLQPGSYLLVPRYGNWSAVSPDPEKYGWDGKNNENNQLGDALKRSGGDIKAPDAAGDYKIVVDFKKGQFNLTKL
jgi:signal peptidase I